MARYLEVYEHEDDPEVAVTLPLEESGNIFLDSLKTQVDTAIGLKFRDPKTMKIMGISAHKGQLYPPIGGWFEKKIFCSFPKGVPSPEKSPDSSPPKPKKSRAEEFQDYLKKPDIKERDIIAKASALLSESEKDNIYLGKKVSKYEAALFSRKRVEKAEKELNFGYKEEDYCQFMKNKFNEVEPREITIKSFHYRIFQYVIHIPSEHLDRRIKDLRQKYGQNREAAHSFCMNMKATYRLLSEDIHDELILLADKQFKLCEIINDLKNLHLKPEQLKSIEDFLVIDGIAI